MARVHQWTDSLALPDLIVLCEVPIEMSLERLISDESLPAVAALELDALVKFSHTDDVELFEKHRLNFKHMLIHKRSFGAKI